MIEGGWEKSRMSRIKEEKWTFVSSYNLFLFILNVLSMLYNNNFHKNFLSYSVFFIQLSIPKTVLRNFNNCLIISLSLLFSSSWLTFWNPRYVNKYWFSSLLYFCHKYFFFVFFPQKSVKSVGRGRIPWLTSS